MSVSCECCVLSGRSLFDELITRPEESYQLWCVVVCDLENLKNKVMGRVGQQRPRCIYIYIYIYTYFHKVAYKMIKYVVLTATYIHKIFIPL